jgi:ubiquinone/menaquinone biosynthesis C-methylase UbiE
VKRRSAARPLTTRDTARHIRPTFCATCGPAPERLDAARCWISLADRAASRFRWRRTFVSVLAVDVEAEMIDVGQQEATIRGAANIEWRVARAEDLQLPSGSRELITIGEAFHRWTKPRILQRSVDWLRPGGSLATLAGESVWRGREPWKRTLVDVVNRWTSRRARRPECRRMGRAAARIAAPRG